MKAKLFCIAVVMSAALGAQSASAQTYGTCSSLNSSLNSNGMDLSMEIAANPFATAALASSIVGLAAFMDDDMSQDARNAMAAVGIVGALWCVWNETNQNKCIRTGARLTSLMVERQNLQSGFNANYCSQYFAR